MTHLLTSCLAKASETLYNNHWGSFTKFMRTTFDLPALPAQSNHVCLYATHLFSLGLQPSSIRNYLTAVAFAHKINGFKDPTDTFKVRKLLDAIKREANCSTFTRQPITKKVLSKLLQGIVKVEKSKYNKKNVKALFSFMYHAGLRVSEVAVSAQFNHTIQVEDVKKTAKAVSLRLRSFKHSKQRSANIRLRLINTWHSGPTLRDPSSELKIKLACLETKLHPF